MEIEVSQNPEEWLNALHKVNLEVFNESIEGELEKRLNSSKNILLLTLGTPEDLWGYKLGYEWSPSTYYSWLGAVSPAFRRRGYGKMLMEKQHAWCQSQGYRKIKTKTLYRWKEMLTLNLALGFDITETYLDNRGEQKIILEKILT